jgi:two-component system, cell cycle sensor histidine kinase and response regulator CckA
MPKEAPMTEPTAMPTILLVDDEAIIREIGEELLTLLGYNVLLAESGERAEEILLAEKPDIALVLLDLIMPGRDGCETYRRLKAVDPAVKVLLATGHGPDDEVRELIDQGCVGYIQKPFTMADLKSRIARILPSSQAS